MGFTWFGVTVVDIGILSVGVVGFAWLFRRIAVLERENGILQAQVNALEKENQDIRKENGDLRKENQDLRKDFDVLAARYGEIKEVLNLILKRQNTID